MPGKRGTKFPGVRYREHASRKHGVGFDRYYSVYYRVDGRNVEEALGWASQGWTPSKVAGVLSELKENARRGEGPKTLAQKRRDEADRRQAEEERRLAEQADEERVIAENVTLDEVMTIYLDWAKSNKRHWTNDEYRYRLHIQPALGQKPMKDITPFAVERLKKTLAESRLSPATVKHCLCIIRQVFNKAFVWDKWSGPNPIKKVSMPKLNNAKLRAITPEEEERLLTELSARSMDVHDQALMALYAGLRFEEIIKMTWQDVDMNARLLIIRGKGGRIRIVPLCDKLVSMLTRRARGDQPTDRVFPSRQKAETPKISHTYWRAVAAAGLNQDQERRFRADFHCLRHTFSTRLASKGVPLNVLRDLLGHADLQMVSRYSHVMPGQAAAAVQSLDDLQAKESTKVRFLKSK